MANELVHVDTSIEEGLREFGIALDMTAEELFDVGVRSVNTALYQAVRAGVAFMAAKEALSSSSPTLSDSTMTDWITERGLTKQRFYECISLAKGYLAIPADQRKSYLAIGKYKAIKLAKLEPEAIAALADGDPDALSDIALMSRAELIKLVENQGKNYDTLANRHKTLEEEVQRLRPRTRAPGVGEFDARTFEVRHESAALEYGARQHIDALETLFRDVLGEAQADPETESLRLKALGLAAGSILARALDLYEALREGLDGEMPVRPHGDLLLSEAERARLRDGVMILNANFEAARDRRQHEADLEAGKHQTGPGRRRGSKNRKGGE